MTYLRDFPLTKDKHEVFEIFGIPDKHYACRICMCTYKNKPRGRCIGIRVYDDWKDVPPALVSQTTLKRTYKRTLPEGALPTAAVKTKENNYTALYPIAAGKPYGTPKPKAQEYAIQN